MLAHEDEIRPKFCKAFRHRGQNITKSESPCHVVVTPMFFYACAEFTTSLAAMVAGFRARLERIVATGQMFLHDEMAGYSGKIEFFTGEYPEIRQAIIAAFHNEKNLMEKYGGYEIYHQGSLKGTIRKLAP